MKTLISISSQESWHRVLAVLMLSIFVCEAFADNAQIYYKTNAPIHVLGDGHADLDAFISSLRLEKLVDLQGHWTRPGESLVQVGDLTDRGPDSLALMLYAMELQQEIEAQGGFAFFLMGNHDMYTVQGLLDYMTTADADKFKIKIRDKSDFNTFVANRPDIGRRKIAATYVVNHTEPLRTWNLSRKGVVVINDNLFIHAGPTSLLLDYEHKEDINRDIQELVNYYQNLGGKKPVKSPSSRAMKLLNYRGPLETRKLISGSSSSFLDIDEIYASFRVKRGLYGHNLTNDGRPEALLENKVYLVDTGMSKKFGGRTSLVTIDPIGGVTSVQGRRSELSTIAERVRIRQLCKFF